MEVQRQFRAIIYESRQGERTDLSDETSYSDYKKSDNSIGEIQQARIRAANRAAEAIPVISELLDRRLIAIDVAALLGRDIKDPENLTAEEREYVDKRDLIGYRINGHSRMSEATERDVIKAVCCDIPLGEAVLDAYMLPSGEKRIGVENTGVALGYSTRFFYQRTKRQSKALKALQGMGFSGEQIWVNILRQGNHRTNAFNLSRVDGLTFLGFSRTSQAKFTQSHPSITS